MSESKKGVLLDKCYGHKRMMGGLVEYAEDSIVSKTILDKPVGTITLFAFDAGQGLSEHQAPYDAVVQGVDGRGVVAIDGVEHVVEVGEIIIMPASVPHSVKAVERFKMLLTMIRE
jgi:quercetin dioxygenase-like cupin family protein